MWSFLKRVTKYLLIFISATFSLYFIISLSPLADSQNVIAGYCQWLWNFIHLNPGDPIVAGTSPASFLLERLGYTLFLSVGAVCISTVLAFGMTILVYKGHPRIMKIMGILSSGITIIPVFLFCVIAEIILNNMNILPMDGRYTWLFILSGIFILGIGNNSLGDIMRGMVAEMERIMSEPYITAAKARGVNVLSQALKPLILGTLNIVFSRLILTMGYGVLVVEYSFRIHGIGLYMFDAAGKSGAGGRDVILLITGIMIGMVCLLFFLNDLIRDRIDRRNLDAG